MEAYRQALASMPPGGLVWGADSDPECVGRYFADRFWEMPDLQSPDVGEHLIDLCGREQIKLIIPTRDGELGFLARLRTDLAAQGVYVAVGSPEAVEICLDKLLFHDHCRREGIPTVPTAAAVDQIAAERFVVKDRRGMGSRGVAVGLSRDRAREYGNWLPEPIFQPVLEGVEYSVDLYVNRAGEVVDAAPRVRLRVHEGESTITETVEHPELVAAATAFATSLELRGHLVIQGFGSGDDVTLLECNPRVGGASTLGFRAGVQTPLWSIQEALGGSVPAQLGAYRRGLRLVRYASDRFMP